MLQRSLDGRHRPATGPASYPTCYPAHDYERSRTSDLSALRRSRSPGTKPKDQQSGLPSFGHCQDTVGMRLSELRRKADPISFTPEFGERRAMAYPAREPPLGTNPPQGPALREGCSLAPDVPPYIRRRTLGADNGPTSRLGSKHQPTTDGRS